MILNQIKSRKMIWITIFKSRNQIIQYLLVASDMRSEGLTSAARLAAWAAAAAAVKCGRDRQYRAAAEERPDSKDAGTEQHPWRPSDS